MKNRYSVLADQFAGQKNMISRRHFLRGFFVAGLATTVVPLIGAGSSTLAAQAPSSQSAPAPKKPLVVYFSRSGNTKQVAEALHKKIGGDIVEIEVIKPYPDDYQATVDLAKEEQKNNARPLIKTKIGNIDEYGVIFLGYPNWWSSMPMPVYTFIEQNKLDGKTIAPFSTHGGGGLGHSVEDLKKLVPHSKILKPLSIPGNTVKAKPDSIAKDIENWIEGLGPALIETTTGNPQIYPDGGY